MFSKTLLRIAILLLSMSVLFSCKKEPEVAVQDQPIVENGSARFSGFTLEEARLAFYDWRSQQDFSRGRSVAGAVTARSEDPGPYYYLWHAVEPLWDFASEGYVVTGGAHTLTYVPIKPIPSLYFGGRGRARLVFFDMPDGEIGFRIIAYIADSTCFQENNHTIEAENFTGVIYQIDTDGNLVLPFVAKGGVITGRFVVEEASEREGGTVESRHPCDGICGPCECNFEGYYPIFTPLAHPQEEPPAGNELAALYHSMIFSTWFYSCDCSNVPPDYSGDIWTSHNDVHNIGSLLPWMPGDGGGATVSNNFGNGDYDSSDIEELLECIYGLSSSNGEGTGEYFEGYLGFTTQDLYPEEFEFLSENQNVIGFLLNLCDGMNETEADECLVQKLLGAAMEIESENIDGFIQAINSLTLAGLSAVELCSFLDVECLLSDDILECVILKISDNIDECGAFDFIWCNDFENSPNGICPESFNFISVGTNSYTCDIAGISFTYTGALQRNIYVGDLCITIPNRNIDGNHISPSEAADLMAGAWNEAQALTAQAFASSNHSMTSVTYKNLFISNLRITMLGYFDGTFGSGAMGIINQKCSGSFPTRMPRYSIWC